MYKNILATLATITLVLASETLNAQSFTSQKGGVCYTLDIPDYMAKTFELNDVASLQYMNTQKEAYVIVIDDDKDQLEELGIKFSNVTEFFDNFTTDYMAGAEGRTMSETVTFNNNGNDHAQTELKWTSDGINYFMLITTIETAGHYYKLLCWTVEENKDNLLVDFKRIASSLME